MIRSLFTALFFCSLAVGCAHAHTPQLPGPSSGLEQTLLQLDREFDRATAEKGVDAWVSYFAPNGVEHHGDHTVSVGPQAIREKMKPLFTRTDRQLRWQPTAARVIAKDLGWTSGTWQIVTTGDDRKQLEAGVYVTVWQLQPDGKWKVASDIGSSDLLGQ